MISSCPAAPVCVSDPAAPACVSETDCFWRFFVSGDERRSKDVEITIHIFKKETKEEMVGTHTSILSGTFRRLRGNCG